MLHLLQAADSVTTDPTGSIGLIGLIVAMQTLEGLVIKWLMNRNTTLTDLMWNQVAPLLAQATAAVNQAAKSEADIRADERRRIYSELDIKPKL